MIVVRVRARVTLKRNSNLDADVFADQLQTNEAEDGADSSVEVFCSPQTCKCPLRV